MWTISLLMPHSCIGYKSDDSPHPSVQDANRIHSMPPLERWPNRQASKWAQGAHHITDGSPPSSCADHRPAAVYDRCCHCDLLLVVGVSTIQHSAVPLAQVCKSHLHCILQEPPVHSKVECHFMAVWQRCLWADPMLQKSQFLC